MYANEPENDKADNRFALTWRGRDDPAEDKSMQWELVPFSTNRTTYAIKNLKHNEFLYAGKSRLRINRRFALTWDGPAEPTKTPNMQWEFICVGENKWAFRNIGWDEFSIAYNEKLNPVRRYVLTWGGTSDPAAIKNMQWRLADVATAMDHASSRCEALPEGPVVIKNRRHQQYFVANGPKPIVAMPAETTTRVNFGKPGLHDLTEWVTLGTRDTSGGRYFRGKAKLGSETFTVKVGRYRYARMNRAPLTGGPSKALSNMLRSSFLCAYKRCGFEMKLYGLTPGNEYSVTTWHHSVAYPRGGTKFTLQWRGESDGKLNRLQQSPDGKNPSPATSHTETVVADTYGQIKLSLDRLPGGHTRGHLNLNGFEITGAIAKPEPKARVNFGRPGRYGLKYWSTLGTRDTSGKRSFGGRAKLDRKRFRVKVDGYTYARMGRPRLLGGPSKSLSSMLRSSFMCAEPECAFSMTLSGLTINNEYTVTTWHHSVLYPRGGTKFSLQWQGESLGKLNSLQQSADGRRPSPALSHTEKVVADGNGEIKLTLKRLPGGVKNAHLNLNGFVIRGEMSAPRSALSTAKVSSDDLKKDLDAQWDLVKLGRSSYAIKNVMHGEFLSADSPMYGSKRRYILGKSGPADPEKDTSMQWEFVCLGPGRWAILNLKHQEYAYANTPLCVDRRKCVLTWGGDDDPAKDKSMQWYLDAVSR
eukprot:gnl/TRDRNA2_/TRDRNA2_84770_c0_seq1.p1 gnl/TRDRNA2_/TRDRNA2_84770_c0~~gnl/TRDRNA2_/TRDRNA2_84770_c0_seq1.p1  ORF type:complete len:769 (+),score=85.42 gnl/TRDRNA2_/TRDRNA2_84770_c0_seq1:213-2309(+)